MSLRVLVVDDSRFFRERLISVLGQDRLIEVVGTAANGLEAVAQCEHLNPDLVTMDVEMPVLDGIGAIRKIMQKRPVPIMMVSSLTRQGATVTLRALEAGALDYIPKSELADLASAPDSAHEFCQRLRTLAVQSVQARRNEAAAASAARARAQKAGTEKAGTEKAGARKAGGAGATADPPLPNRAPARSRPVEWQRFKLLLIGASTDGPIAVMELVRNLSPQLPVPVVIVQHMPEHFTEAYARRLNELCSFDVAEARDGESLRAGQIRVAPGGRQLQVDRGGGGPLMRVRERAPGDLYHPCIDLAFNSAADAIGGNVLAIVLTGMGRDGSAGSQRLKSLGAEIWAQDEGSCVVYGMPRAVAEAGAADRVLPLTAMSRLLSEAHS